MISIQPAEQEREKRNRLAETIERRQGEIIHRWLDAVRAQNVGKAVRLTDLQNAMPDYLVAMMRALRQEGGTVERGGTHAWVAVAREHGLTRARLGFDIEQLVREFIVLRQILFDVASEEGVLCEERQTRRVADLVESAMAAAVKSYVECRDYAARRLEAEHVGFVTHELRNPLTTADLMATKLKKELSLTALQARELDLLIRNLDRLGDLIDSVLLVEKFDANEVKAEAREVTLGEFVEGPMEAAREAAVAKNLELETDFDPTVLVYADPSLTRSVISNLLDNAIKYTDDGIVKLVAGETPREVVMHVYDNCEGLSAEELKTIFEPFRRGKHSSKPGTGLGLAIARRAVVAQGGVIAAESEPERGCHFWFTLPKARH